MINPTEFVKGAQYTNRKGTFTVVDLHPPTMTVRFEDGTEETLDIKIQQRILSNMTLPPRTPEPPPRARTGSRTAAKTGAKAKTPATTAAAE